MIGYWAGMFHNPCGTVYSAGICFTTLVVLYTLQVYVSQPLCYCKEQSIFLMSQWQCVIKINPKVKSLGQTLTFSLHLPAYRQTNILIQIWMTLSGLQPFLQEDDSHIVQHFIETPSPSPPQPPQHTLLPSRQAICHIRTYNNLRYM